MGTKSHGTSTDNKKKNESDKVGSQNRRKYHQEIKKQQFWHRVRTVVVVSAVTRNDLCYDKKLSCSSKSQILENAQLYGKYKVKELTVEVSTNRYVYFNKLI